MKTLDVAALFKRVPALGHLAADAASIVELRDGAGVKIGTDRRDELLAAAARGDYVAIEVDYLAYEQKAGVTNRNYVRFRDGALVALGSTGVGTPFLRDHDTDNLSARAGTVTASKTTKLDEGHYQIRQTARITAPWAVDALLRGNLDRVSIGARPTGPVECSLCKAPIFTVCYHYPGQRFAEREDSAGKKYLARDATGDRVVEWIYTAGELAESSGVSVPAVPTAAIEGIRAALSAAHIDLDADVEEEISEMKNFPVLATRLGLAATAGEDEVMTAVDAALKERDTLRAELKIVDGERAKLAATVEEHKKKEREVALETFLRDGINSGRIDESDRPVFRDLYEANPERAIARMNERAPQAKTPVGATPQSKTEAPTNANGTAPAPGDAAALAALKEHGVDPTTAMAMAKKMGATNPEATLARLLAPQLAKGG